MQPPGASTRSPIDAVVAAGCVAVAMLLTSMASFAFEDIQGWPIVSMVAMCMGLLSINIGATCAAEQQGNHNSSAVGLCGGNLLLLWLKWFASASVTSSFAITATAWRSGAEVPPASLWLSLASIFCALLSWWWWQCSDGNKANLSTSPTPVAAKLVGALLSIGLLLCLVAALLSPTDAPVGSSTAAVTQSATHAPNPSPSVVSPVLRADAGPTTPAPAGSPGTSPAVATSTGGMLRDVRNGTSDSDAQQPAAAKGMSDGVVTVGVIGCAVAMMGMIGLALGKKDGARRLLGSKQGEASYGGSGGDEELSRELSAQGSTNNPVQGATAAV